MARLPGLKEEVFDKLRDVEQELVGLPESLSENPQIDLSKLCIKFVKDVENYAGGKPNDDPSQRTFLRDSLSHYRSLKDRILSTRPHFKVGLSNSRQVNGILEVVPQPPSLEPEAPPAQNQTEKEQMSLKRLQRKAPNQGNIRFKLR